MSDIMTPFGAGLLALGTIAAIGQMDRKGKIKSALRENFHPPDRSAFHQK